MNSNIVNCIHYGSWSILNLNSLHKLWILWIPTLLIVFIMKAELFWIKTFYINTSQIVHHECHECHGVWVKIKKYYPFYRSNTVDHNTSKCFPWSLPILNHRDSMSPHLSVHIFTRSALFIWSIFQCNVSLTK